MKSKLIIRIRETINLLIQNSNANFTTIYKNIIQNVNKILDIKDFKKISKYIPFKYFLVHKEGMHFRFNYLFPLIQSIFIEFEISEEEQIAKNYFDMTKGENAESAWPFERLVNHFFKIGHKPFEDLNLIIKKSIQVNQILNLKDIFIENEFTIDENNKNKLIFLSEEEKKILLSH